MKRNILLLGAFVLAAFGMQSCLDYDDPGSELSSNQTSGDTEVYHGNVDEINYTKEISEAGFKEAKEGLANYFAQSKTGQYCLRGAKSTDTPPKAHAYQRQYSLGPDAYAGYFVVPHSDFMYGTLSSTYAISDEFNSGPLGSYTEMKNCIIPLLNHPLIDSIPEMKAINLLYYSLGAQEMADLSGPFTYEEDKQNSENPTTYNDLQTIYTGIVENIDTIVKCLQHFEERPDWYKEEMQTLLLDYTVTTRDLLEGYSGVTSFIKLANSLKLRMAMHIVKVDPTTAQKWAEEAVDPENGGVIESIKEQQASYPMLHGTSHPLIDIFTSWGDLRLCASFESLLMSLHHPYVYDPENEKNNYEGYVFELNNNPITNERTNEVTPKGSVICGLRAGTLFGALGQSYPTNPFEAYSSIKSDAFAMAPCYLIKFSEVDFLRAEGAIRGWDMGGGAEFFYNRGIENAYLEDPFMYEGAAYERCVEDYMNLEKPYDYVNKDYYGGGEDWPSVTTIGVKWNESDSQETKLEKIITQKYIAIFPLSTEAWTELRRTGYPKIFPVLNADDGDGTIVQGDIIRRIPWVATDPQVKAAIEATGLDALGGDDFQATRLWWDVDAANF